MTDSLEEDISVAAPNHGGVIRMAVVRLLEMRLTAMARLRVDPGSVTVLKKAGGVWRLVQLNDTCRMKTGD